MNYNICTAIKKDGDKCGSWAMRDEDFCWRHSKSKRAEITRQYEQHIRRCIREINTEGMLYVFSKLFLEIAEDRKQDIVKQSYALLELSDKISHLEARL